MTDDSTFRALTRRRPPWLAPLLVGITALPVGGALALGIAGRDTGDSLTDIANAGTTLSASQTSEPAVVSTPDTTTAPSTTLAPVAAVPLGAPAEGTARVTVDGIATTYIERQSCIAFPYFNANTGMGGGGSLNISLHLLESVAGDRIVVQFESFDFGGQVGLFPIAGVGGVVETFDLRQIEPHLIDVGGIEFSVEAGSLTSSSSTCDSALIEGEADFDAFSSLGVIDACLASDDAPFADIFTFQNGNSLVLDRSDENDVVSGTLHLDGAKHTLTGASATITETGAFLVVGTLSPAPFDNSDNFSLEVRSSGFNVRGCLEAQEAAALQD